MDNWMKTSKYYVTWDEYVAAHPEIDEKNLEAMKDRFVAYQDKMFRAVMAFLF